ncbi:MAG: tetratricopeptide repeat protein [Candidatus Auribacterota bacterium]
MKKTNGIMQFLTTLSWILTLMFVLGITMRPLTDFTIWTDLAIGKYIIKHFSVPSQEIFSFTSPNFRYIDENWLFQAVAFILYKAIGMSGLIIAKSLFLTAVAVLMLILARRRRWNVAVAGFCITLIFYQFHEKWLLRSQIIGVILMLCMIYTLMSYHASRKTRYLLPLPYIMFIWVNVHPSFILGIIILIFFTVSEYIKKAIRQQMAFWFGPSLKWKNLLYLMGASILSILVVFLNPNGKDILSYSIESNNASLLNTFHASFISERVWLRQIPLLILPAITLLSMFFVPQRRTDSTHGILMIITFGACFAMKRYAIFPFILTLPFAIKYLSHITDLAVHEAQVSGRDFRKHASTAILALCAGGIVTFTSLYMTNPASPQIFSPSDRADFFPEDLVNHIKHYPANNNIYLPIEYSGFFLYHLFPDYPIFIDTRIPFINPVPMIDDLKLHEAQVGWEFLTNKYHFNTLILRTTLGQRHIVTPRDSFHEKIAQSPDWRVAYWDDNNIMYTRTYHNLTEEERDTLYVSLDPENIAQFLTDDPLKLRSLKRELNRRYNQAPPSAWCSVYLGILAMKAGDADAAREHFKTARSIMPENPNVAIFDDVLAWHYNNSEEALASLTGTFESPQEGALQAAYALILMNHYKSAEKIASYLVKSNPNNVEGLILLGTCKDINGDYINALASFQNALLLEPSNVYIHLAMSKCYMHNGVWDQSAERLREALNIDDTNYLLWYQLGETYIKQGSYNFALSMFHKVTRLRPHHLPSWIYIGTVYRKTGQYKEAFEALKRALVLDPFSDTVYVELAETFMDVNKYDNADKIVAELEKQDDDAFFTTDPRFLFIKARLSAQKGDKETTYTLTKKVLEYGGLDTREQFLTGKEFAPYLEDTQFRDILQ